MAVYASPSRMPQPAMVRIRNEEMLASVVCVPTFVNISDELL